MQQQLSKKEIEDLLRRGAYGAIMDEEDEGAKFCEEDIDQILQRRTKTITIESEGRGSTFAKVNEIDKLMLDLYQILTFDQDHLVIPTYMANMIIILMFAFRPVLWHLETAQTSLWMTPTFGTSGPKRLTLIWIWSMAEYVLHHNCCNTQHTFFSKMCYISQRHAQTSATVVNVQYQTL